MGLVRFSLNLLAALFCLARILALLCFAAFWGGGWWRTVLTSSPDADTHARLSDWKFLLGCLTVSIATSILAASRHRALTKSGNEELLPIGIHIFWWLLGTWLTCLLLVPWLVLTTPRWGETRLDPQVVRFLRFARSIRPTLWVILSAVVLFMVIGLCQWRQAREEWLDKERTRLQTILATKWSQECADVFRESRPIIEAAKRSLLYPDVFRDSRPIIESDASPSEDSEILTPVEDCWMFVFWHSHECGWRAFRYLGRRDEYRECVVWRKVPIPSSIVDLDYLKRYIEINTLERLRFVACCQTSHWRHGVLVPEDQVHLFPLGVREDRADAYPPHYAYSGEAIVLSFKDRRVVAAKSFESPRGAVASWIGLPWSVWHSSGTADDDPHYLAESVPVDDPWEEPP